MPTLLPDVALVTPDVKWPRFVLKLSKKIGAACEAAARSEPIATRARFRQCLPRTDVRCIFSLRTKRADICNSCDQVVRTKQTSASTHALNSGLPRGTLPAGGLVSKKNLAQILEFGRGA